jgi:ligand-binding sensor domain-containing protein/two-component sensor histidine kinase
MRWITFFLFFLQLVKANSQELFFSSLPVFQNLPSFETYDILQDRKGFIWITTDAGICRYDGTELKVFTSKDGIAENVVFRVYQDDKDRIWFSTISGYFFYYENDAFHSIAANAELKELCNSSQLTSFFIGENDTLICATNAIRALLKIPPQNNYKKVIIDKTNFVDSVTRFLILNKSHLEECVTVNREMEEQKKFFLFSFNKQILKIPIRLSPVNYSGNFSKIKSDSHGNAYIPNNTQLIVVSRDGVITGNFYSPSVIINCYVDADNDLWVGTFQNGGYLFRNADVSKPPIRFLNNLSVSSIKMDREGSIWVATLEKGIFRSLNKHLLFINDESNKSVYLQKDSQRLNITFNKKKIISLYKNDSLYYNDIKINIPDNYNLFSSYLDDKYSYFGFAIKFYILNRKKSAVPVKFNTTLNAKEIVKIGQDSILVLTPFLLAYFYGEKGEIINTPFPGRFAIQLKNKKILISTRNSSGIYELNNEKFIPYIPQLSKIRVNCMTEDASGNLWIATNEKGLYCYDAAKKLHHLPTNNLIGDKINTLTIDERNNVWAGSYNGLAKLSYPKGLQRVEITKFNKSNGLPSLQIERVCSFDGKIACISKDFFFYFKDTGLKKNTTPPLNYIESVSINDQAYDVKSNPVVSYDKNNFHVLSSLITYKNTEQRKFLYKLAGYDQAWHYSTSGDVLYTNLPYGKYEFMIYGLNNDNLKSAAPATFAFEIKKPFWLTWWFILLEVASLFTAIYFYFRYLKSKIEKREHEKAATNQQISEFKMTALRSQMNPHFIFNAIGSIQHYILQNEVKQSYNYLTKFSMLIRNILNNSRQEYIFLEQEINTLRLYIELEQIRFAEPFQFNIEIDEKLDMEMDIPTMLIQPYIENSIWHGLMPKKTGGILELIFKKEGDSMLVIIRDNGLGRQITDPAKKHVSKGMSITEQRINILTSTNKKKFITTIIDLKDENGHSIGTEVRLMIPLDRG